MIKEIVKLVIFLGLTSIVKSDETKALLELIADCHVVKPTAKAGDYINYTIVVRQTEKSKLDAVEIVVAIILPASVRFAVFSTTPTNRSVYSSTLYSNNHAEFTFDSLPIRKHVQFNFSALVTDSSLSSGLHYASTSIKLSHKSKLVNGDITRIPFESSRVAPVPFLVAGCLNPLGMSDGRIKFYQLSASTTQVDLKPDKARYNGNDDAWCADVRDTQPYVQVFMASLTKVTGVATWGRKEKALWVKKYTVEFSLDGQKWYAYGETGFTKQFDGNYDRFTKVQHWLIEPIVANYVRLRPIEWSVGVCLRFELYGCIIGSEANCILPLGMENGKIPLSSLSSLKSPEVGYPSTLNFSRLNKVVRDWPNGWMATYSSEDWLEIDLGSSYRVTALALQGAWGEKKTASYVRTFQFRYSNDSTEWNKIITDKKGTEKTFPGQQGGLLADMIYLTPTIIARYVRIIPTEGHVLKVMRLELYGCLIDEHLHLQDVHMPLPRRSVLLDQNDNTIFVCVYSDDRGKSICKRSSDGKFWKSLNPNILGILYQARVSRRLFAVDRDFSKAFSDDGGDTWYTISQKEWERQTIGLDMISSTNIDDILPSKKPDDELTWMATNGKKWGVSGNGIHMKDTDIQDWVLSASWKCCGL